jgi:hypothetical protein
MLGAKHGENPLIAPEIYKMQFFRRKPDDVGIADLPIGEKQDARETAKRALLGYFNNKHIAPAQRPHHARVVTWDGSKVILTLMATGPTTVEDVLHADRT